MQHKPFFLIHILIFLVFFNTSINAEQLEVLPLKKPILEKSNQKNNSTGNFKTKTET